MERILRYFESYLQKRANYLVEQELMRLSDKQLNDMGISRSEIKDAVWKHSR